MPTGDPLFGLSGTGTQVTFLHRSKYGPDTGIDRRATVPPDHRRAVRAHPGGDRFWYELDVSPGDLTEICRTALAEPIRRNRAIGNIQANAFCFEVAVWGQVYFDFDRGGG